jgi:peptidoglycan hydrolase CwlO-like protein
MDEAKTKQFQTDMQAIIAGEKDAPNGTIKHFAARFKEAQAKHDELSKGLGELEQKMAQGKIELAKTTGFIENLAQDLRHLWDESSASAKDVEAAGKVAASGAQG